MEKIKSKKQNNKISTDDFCKAFLQAIEEERISFVVIGWKYDGLLKTIITIDDEVIYEKDGYLES